MRCFLLLLFSLRAFASSFDDVTPSTPEEIASLNANLLVEGFVSASSGQLSLVETDLHVKGAQDLSLKRIYIPPRILGRYDHKAERDRLELGKALTQLQSNGWVAFPHLRAGYNSHSPHFQIRDPQGTVLEFQIEGNKGYLKTAGFGCTNLRGEHPSAEADIRNVKLSIEGTQVTVLWPNGTQRVYLHRGAKVWWLDYELLPNGKAIRYVYNNQGLARIAATDTSGAHTYATMDRISGQKYRSSDGREAELFYELQEVKGKVKKDKLKQEFSFTFPVLKKALNPYYTNTISYNDRTLISTYDAKNFPISCTYGEQKGAPCRIQSFSTPSGSTTFSYDSPVAGKKGGSTTVTRPNGSQTIYRFNAHFLLTNLENWFEGKLYNQKLFFYDHKQHISRIETRGGEGNLLLAKIFECDQAGNPLIERWEGDFGYYCIQRTFSKNRIIREDYSDGLGFIYEYLGDTHLLTTKVTLANGKPVRRTEYRYDAQANLIEEKEVGQTITAYILYQEGAHLHRPQWKIEKDWEGNLIHKTQLSYDRFGNIAEELSFGSDDVLAYRTTKLYDSHDHLLEETNPLNQTASFSYDLRGNQITEIPYAQNKVINRSFDEKGRLLTMEDGTHTTRFTYNASDELIHKVDYLGVETRYWYHAVHGKPTIIQSNPTSLWITYDDFGREIARKDTYGATTITQPNSYGDPLSIAYPDGGKETFHYASNRTLLRAVDPDGLQTSYTYDPLGRILSKTVGSRTTTYSYDAYNLLKETNPLGDSTAYEYNVAGQKIREAQGDRIVQFSYDSLGFISKTDNGLRYTTYKNDVLGRVLTQSVDGQLDTSYTYDPAGNVAAITKQDTTRFVYDSYNRLLEKIEGDGAKTSITYTEGPRLLTKTITTPRGTQQIETYNAHGLLLKKEVPGCTLEEYSYDRELRLIAQDHLTFTYTPEGRRASCTEAGQRTTNWSYTPGGKVQTKTKPDGTCLIYKYTNDGDLEGVGSREFQYDALGRVIKGTGFSREYDLFGNVIREEFDSGLFVTTTYDHSDRPTLRMLPDGSQIHYEYAGAFLRKINRLNANGDLLYSHAYDQFDLNGRILSETGFFNSSYQYDKAGRRISQTTPYFTEDLAYDENGNLLRSGDHSYGYDPADQLTFSSKQGTLTYDKRYNRIQKNSDRIEIDALNQIEDLSYDRSGNLLQEGFKFDEFNQLVEAGNETIRYDALGRRIQKGSTSYLYFGNEEVAAYENGQVKELKIPGTVGPIAIEMESATYFPVADVQGTIRMLIDPKTQEVGKRNTCDVFGVGLSQEIPYAYTGKRYDAESGLVYFGKRYYVPGLGRWLTPDPIGPVDHSNLYQYVFNNPYRYSDPNGESIGGYLLGLSEIVLGSALIFTGGVLEIASFGGYTIACGFQMSAGATLIGSGLAMTAYHAQDMKMPTFSSRNPSLSSGHMRETTLPINNLDSTVMQRNKKGGVDKTLSNDPLNDPNLEDVSHPDAKKRGHHQLKDKKTGETITYDKGKPYTTGHEAHDHYHRPNPNSIGNYDKYLDANGNPVPKGSQPSHLYPPDWVWWN